MSVAKRKAISGSSGAARVLAAIALIAGSPLLSAVSVPPLSSMPVLGLMSGVAASPANQVSLNDQTSFRLEFGLSTDPGYIAAVDKDPSASASPFGVPLLPVELAEIASRPNDADVAPITAFGLANPDLFGGVYIDQSAGGVVDVALTGDPEAYAASLAALLSTTISLRVRSVVWSERQLNSAVSAVTEAIPSLAAQGIHVAKVAPDIQANTTDVFVSGDPAAVSARLVELFGPIIRVISGAPAVPASCVRTSCPPPWRGGLAVHGTEYCTSGYIARLTGTTNYVMVTAGHCGVLGTPFNNDTTVIGSVTGSVYYNGTTADALRIGISPSTKSNWIWVASTDTQHVISGYTTGYTVGSTVCKSGNSSGETCGGVTANGVSVTYTTNGYVIKQQSEANFLTKPGDSGAPVFGFSNSHSLYGIDASVNPNNPFDSYFSTVANIDGDMGLTPCLNSSCN